LATTGVTGEGFNKEKQGYRRKETKKRPDQNNDLAFSFKTVNMTLKGDLRHMAAEIKVSISCFFALNFEKC
jgi:hypothetical protein